MAKTMRSGMALLLSLLLHLVPNRIKEGDRNDHGIVATISTSVLS